MTKLMQWLIFIVAFLSVWLLLVTNKLNNNTLQKYSDFVVFFPIFIIIFFGIYSVIVILWRVVTFNNCEDAAEELKCQIEEARKDLITKGFVFKLKQS